MIPCAQRRFTGAPRRAWILPFAQVAGTSAVDDTLPSTGTGLFYLVTGVNRLREEGTKGRSSSGTERANPLPCP